MGRFLLDIVGDIVLRAIFTFVAAILAFTWASIREIDNQEIERPSEPSAWINEIAGVGVAGGVLGALAGATLALLFVQYQPGLVGAFPINWSDWAIS